MNKIKKIALRIEMIQTKDTSPNLESHMGGAPFLIEKESYPNCEECGKKLTFVHQIYMPQYKDQKSVLYALYKCEICSTKEKTVTKLKQYITPELQEMKKENIKNPKNPYFKYQMQLAWSFPEWSLFQFLYPQEMKKILNDSQNEEDAYNKYQNAKKNYIYYLTDEEYTFVGGHPQFISQPIYPICQCCEEPMELFMQIDSDQKKKLKWSQNGCLYLFVCRNGKGNMTSIVQSI